MVIPLLAAAALRMGAGAAVRGVATRAVTSVGTKAAINSMGGRLASNAVGAYGVNAIQKQHQNRQEAATPHPVHGGNPIRWARENPGQALIGATYMATRSTGLPDQAASQTQALLQSTQFGQ